MSTLSGSYQYCEGAQENGAGPRVIVTVGLTLVPLMPTAPYKLYLDNNATQNLSIAA